MGSPHSCPSVRIDNLDMNRMEDFADYLPEGITLLPPGTYNAKMSSRHGCLCGVDMDATASANGYTVEEGPYAHFTFTLLDTDHDPRKAPAHLHVSGTA